MLNGKKWYKNPKIVRPLIIGIVVAIIGATWSFLLDHLIGIVAAIIGATSTTIPPTPTTTLLPPKIWEIGYYDGSYAEFDSLETYIFPGPYPWHYNVGDQFNKFPKEINDGKRTPINIRFSLTNEQSKNDFILTLIIESVGKNEGVVNDNFKIRIRTQNGVIGEYIFNNTEKKQDIIIKKDLVAAGDNTIILENANKDYGRWMLWDYLKLSVKSQN